MYLIHTIKIIIISDDEWDPNAGIFGEMDYSTFVAQRLKEVNEQWDKEPLPQGSRQKFIEFKQVQRGMREQLEPA